MEQRDDVGQIGVCYFADNKQCEEWALEKGYCPVGGVKVTGYNTPAAALLRDHRRHVYGDRHDARWAGGWQLRPAER